MLYSWFSGWTQWKKNGVKADRKKNVRRHSTRVRRRNTEHITPCSLPRVITSSQGFGARKTYSHPYILQIWRDRSSCMEDFNVPHMSKHDPSQIPLQDLTWRIGLFMTRGHNTIWTCICCQHISRQLFDVASRLKISSCSRLRPALPEIHSFCIWLEYSRSGTYARQISRIGNWPKQKILTSTS